MSLAVPAPAAGGLPRSSSNHHLAPSVSVGQLSHYSSHHDPSTTSATPHLSHLRQSSSIGFGLNQHGHPDDHHSHYPTSAEGYDVYEEIGVGAFATVYHAAVRETGEQVAVKVIDLDQFNTNWEEIRREIMIMSLVHHPNVVRILTSFVEEQDLWIIMPLLEGGSCAHIMKTIYPTGMKDEAMIATILKEVLLGLLYFHKDGRLHRDLKAGNVLISAQGDVQLADFGVAGTLLENGDRKKARRTFTGTPCWMAPEVMEHNENGYDEKADIWSFGITAMELAYGRAPYAKFPPMKVMVLTLQEEPPTVDIFKDHSYEFSRHFQSMIEKCLKKDPTKRPSVKKLLEHKFFKQAKDKAYLVEKIIKKMPVKRRPNNVKLLNICELRRHNTLNSADPNEEKGKPVSVGSWVFDKDEFDEMKRQALVDSDGARHASVQASYAEEETPRHGQPAPATYNGTPATNCRLGANAPIYLNLPSSKPTNTSQPHVRTPSVGAHPSSAEESTDDDDEHHSSEDEHRPIPDFSPPPASLFPPPESRPRRNCSANTREDDDDSRHQGVRTVSKSQATPTPSPQPPVTAKYSQQSPQPVAPAPQVTITTPEGNTAHPKSDGSLSPVNSPGEHHEGRFLVSDDGEEEQQQHPTDEHGLQPQSADPHVPLGEEQPAHGGVQQPFMYNGQPVYPAHESYPAHDNYYAHIDPSNPSPTSHDEAGETHVGRFAVMDDGDEQDQ